jgi:hypothetical protein
MKRLLVLSIAGAVWAAAAAPLAMAAAPSPVPAPVPSPTPTPEQVRALAIRAAQVDAYQRLADLILAAPVADSKTFGELLGPDGDQEIALRVFLRSESVVGDPRVYSDGVAEADAEVPFEGVARAVAALTSPHSGHVNLDGLRAQAVDGYLRTSGRGRAPDDISPEAVKKILAARPEEFVEIFPVGWERVTATGRVVAQRRARVRAYAAMKVLVQSIRVNPTSTVGDAFGAPAAEALLDVFVSGLPLAGPPRLMPDRVAEVDVAASVRDLIKFLKDVRPVGIGDDRWNDEEIDQLSINLKAERLTVTGRGMPPTDQVRPPEAMAGEPGPPMPDWAATVLEGRGVAKRPDDVENEAEARLLAARAAKARAAEQIERLLDDVRLDDGRTVRDRAAKDEVFRKDITTLLASAKTVKYQVSSDGKQWEVVLRLPLVRLWEFSRPRE